jgi:hypothetical protein
LKNWQKAAIMTLISLAIGGIYLLFVFEQRRNPGVNSQNTQQQPESPDDVAEVRMMFPTSFDDVLKLENTSVWMKNGYTMPYFPYEGGHIVFAKSAGVIPSAQRLDIKKVIRAAAPAQVDDGISHGTRQAFAVFMLPGSTTLYATAIGAIDGSQEEYFSDILFFYDDPHKIYDNWPKNVWTAIDAHQVLPGMSELQTRMSIGQKTQSDGSSEGNRTVTYDQAGKTWTVTFVDNKATTIKSQ